MLFLWGDNIGGEECMGFVICQNRINGARFFATLDVCFAVACGNRLI